MSYTDESRRHIGFFGATGIGIGAIVGGGILALAGVAFAESGPSALVAFAINGLIAFMTAMSFAAMSSAFPESGGAYTFTKKVLSVRAAFAVGWILWFAFISAGVLYAMGFSSYAASALQSIFHAFTGMPHIWLESRYLKIILSLGAILFYTWKISLKRAGTTQWETIGKVILFSVLILSGFFIFTNRPSGLTHEKFIPFFGGGILGIFQTMGYTFITFQGFDIIATVAGEIRSPKRNIPLSMFASLCVAAMIYFPFLFIMSTLGPGEGQSIMNLAVRYPDTLVAIATRNFLGPAGYWMIIIVAILSMLSALYANMLAASHIAFAMALDRTLPRFFGKVLEDSKVPFKALYISGIIMSVIIIATPNLSVAGAAASLVFLISFTLTHITAILTGLRMGHHRAGFVSYAFPLVPFIGAILCGSLAGFQGISVPSAGKIIIIWLAIGFMFYFTFLSSRAEVVDAMTLAREPRLVKLRGHSPLVLVPVANPSRANAMIEVANALSPPQAGRAVLLTVLPKSIESDNKTPPSDLSSTQDLIKEALTASYRYDFSPEVLITLAPHPWFEIIRVARMHRCESLLIGLGDIIEERMDPYIEELIGKVNSDVVLLRAPSGWQLSQVKRILVPVGGKGGNDKLRARLLGSLYRSSEPEVTFLRVVPPGTTEKEFKYIRYKLTRFAEDEVPFHPKVEVVRNKNIVDALKEYAMESDLIILGIKRIGPHKKVFGETALKIILSVSGPMILISRKG